MPWPHIYSKRDQEKIYRKKINDVKAKSIMQRQEKQGQEKSNNIQFILQI